MLLTQHQAVAIYEQRPRNHESVNFKNVSKSRMLGEKFGVSPKTIRDIWNRRTWVSATLRLFLNDQQSAGASPADQLTEVCQSILLLLLQT